VIPPNHAFFPQTLLVQQKDAALAGAYGFGAVKTED
jgi:hypothetical protein